MLGPTLLHSVSYSGSWGQWFLPLEEFIDHAADLGFEGVMLMAKRPHLSPLDYRAPEALARLRDRLRERKLNTVVIAGYTNFTADLEHGEVPTREIQIQHVLELVRVANGIGANMVRVFTGYEHPAAPLSAQWNMLVSALRECAQKAKPYGVAIGVQNHHDIAAGHESMLDLIRAVNEPNCRAFFDAWSPALHGDDIVKAAAKLAPVTTHTTAADYSLRPRYKYQPQLVNYTRETPYAQMVPMGEGFIDYPGFFRALCDGGFRGSVAFEICAPLVEGGDMDTLDWYARKFIEYVHALRSSYGASAS